MRITFVLSTILLFTANIFADVNAAAARKQPAPVEVAAAPQQPGGYDEVISLFIENDYGFSDRYYTNGLKLMYTGAGDDFLTSRLQFGVLRLFGMEGRQAYQTVSVAQQMFVPSEISNPNPPAWDRPYAGWLNVGFGAHLASKDRLDSLTVNLGVVGPYSLAENAQKFWHSIVEADWPMGWHEQIKNEPGIIISYNHTERLLRRDLSNSFSTDLLASAGADLGNVMSQGVVRSFWRFGFNMPYSFEANRMDNSNGTDVAWRPTDASPDWHCYMYAGGAARFVGYDITLNGNTYRNSRSVTPNWFVAEAMVGISSRYKMIQADLNWTLRSSEFTAQEYCPHMFWTLSVKVFF